MGRMQENSKQTDEQKQEITKIPLDEDLVVEYFLEQLFKKNIINSKTYSNARKELHKKRDKGE